MKITKEQEEEISKMVKESEYEIIYICVKCDTRLKGQIKVREHVDEYKHYEYKSTKCDGRLMFL